MMNISRNVRNNKHSDGGGGWWIKMLVLFQAILVLAADYDMHQAGKRELFSADDH